MRLNLFLISMVIFLSSKCQFLVASRAKDIVKFLAEIKERQGSLRREMVNELRDELKKLPAQK